MDKSRYDKTVIDKLNYLEEHDDSSDVNTLEIANELLDYALTTENITLKGYAYYYCGRIYYFLKNEQQMTACIHKSIDLFEQAEEYVMIIRCYTLLTLLLQYQGKYTEAVDYYFAGIKVIQAHRLYSEGVFLLLNLSSLCEDIEDYENALFYRNQCFEYIFQNPESMIRNDAVLTISSMLLHLYLKLERTDEANHEYARLQHYLRHNTLGTCGFDVYMYQLEYAAFIKDEELEHSLFDSTLKAFHSCNNIIEYFDECINFINYLRNRKDYTHAAEVLKKITDELNGDSYLDRYIVVLKTKIDLYQAAGQTYERNAALEEYYRVSCRLDNTRLASVKSTIHLRIDLQQVEIHNLFLENAADTDAMTGLANRRKLNDVADSIFQDTYEKKLSLAAAMLDIDNFKGHNDKYGHRVGDKCIIAVSEVIKSIECLNIFCARYGGDEFIIIFRNLNDEQVLKYCKDISDRVREKGIELGVDNLSVSIGIKSSVPVEGNKIWDYNAIADEALYWVKKNGRNGIRLVHTLKEVQNLP